MKKTWISAAFSPVILVILYGGRKILVSFFGVGYIDAVMEAVTLFLLSLPIFGIACAIAWQCGSHSLSERKMVVCAILAYGIVLLPHTWMSHKLMPIKREFVQIAEKRDGVRLYKTDEFVDGRQTGLLDYGGALCPPLDKRDKILHRNGFVRLGGWWVSDNGITTSAIYIWCPLFTRFTKIE